MQFSKIIKTYFFRSIIVLLSFLIITGCKKEEEEEKQPFADFTTDRTEYFEGETIYLSSKSTNADHYRWTLPDGQTVKGSTITYDIGSLSYDRNIQFKLEAISKKGTKVDYIVKNIPVKVKMGQLVIYNFYYQGNWAATATIDGLPQQIIMPSTTQEPNCGEGGHPTFNLKVGSHFVDVRVGNQTLWSGNVNITHNTCLKLQVF